MADSWRRHVCASIFSIIRGECMVPRVKDNHHRQAAASHDRLVVDLPGGARPDNLPRADSEGS